MSLQEIWLKPPEMAQLWGISTVAFNNHVKDGNIPIKAKGGKYPAFATTRIYCTYLRKGFQVKDAPSLTEARTKLTSNRAEIAEIERMTLTRELVETHQAERILGDLLGVIRQRLLGLPSRIAPRVFRLRTAAEMQDMIKREINGLLASVSELTIDATLRLVQGKSARAVAPTDQKPGPTADAEHQLVG